MAAEQQVSAAKGASLLVMLQIGSRILTFAVNQILLRFLAPELLGASAQLELLCTTIIYFSRDSFRVAQQRQANVPQAVVNIGYLPNLFGWALALLFGGIYSRNGLPEVPHVQEAFLAYVLSSLVELLMEPFFAVCVLKSAYGARARAESAATLFRCFASLATVAMGRYLHFDVGVLPFAAGQMSYATTLLAMYAIQTLPMASKEGFKLYPRKVNVDPTQFLFSTFSKPVLAIWLNLYAQSGVKYLLTSGDAILITRMATLQDQGVYALAANYGGLIARMLFQPIEDSTRGLFARSCASDPKTKKPRAEGLKQALSSLQTVLRFYMIVALASWSMGPTIAPLLLQIVAGERWIASGAGVVLAAYCYYIPFLAVNGVTEAFVAAVASPKDLRFQSVLMIFYSAAFVAAAYVGLVVLELGARGLVLANSVNMLCRIVWNFAFVRSFFRLHGQKFDFADFLPSGFSIAAAVGGAATLASMEHSNIEQAASNFLGDLVRQGGLGAVVGITILAGERRFLASCYRSVRPTASPAKKTN